MSVSQLFMEIAHFVCFKLNKGKIVFEFKNRGIFICQKCFNGSETLIVFALVGTVVDLYSLLDDIFISFSRG